MNIKLLKDRRTASLLNQVSDDVSQLKGNIGLLLGDTTKRAIPEGAREVSKLARQQFAVGSNLARARLNDIRSNHSTCSLGIAGGALLVGAIALGYFLLKDRIAISCECNDKAADDESLDDASVLNPSGL